MRPGGFAGRILRVDLTRREVEISPLDGGLAEKFIGGLGLCVKLAWDRIKPGTDPLSPDNPMVLGAGPLVGTSIPASSRVYGITKFPSSGTIGWCGGGGGRWGCNLKNAGFDHLIIEGRADRPVWLNIEDDRIEIEDAAFLWGRGIAETCETLWEREGRSAGIVAIGPGGENQVVFSMASIDNLATLGRGGFGAVLGSKNLKAIRVRGTKGVRVADPKQYRELNEKLLTRIRSYPQLREWQELGLLKTLPLLPKEDYFKIKKRRVACVSCPIGDKDVIEFREGPFQGLRFCSTSAANLATPLIYGFRDRVEAVKCVTTLDDFGLDMFEFFGVMALAGKLVEQGVIPVDQAEPEIRMDSLASMEAWAGKISRGEGLGKVLGKGFRGIAAEFGEETRRFAPPLVKGMQPYIGPQGPMIWNLFGTQELGQVLDPRGPHVGAGGSPTYFARRPLEAFPSHLDRMGASEEAIRRILPGLGVPGQTPDLRIGRLLKYSHRWFAILGSLGICARGQVNRFYSAALCADLYRAVTGLDTDLEGLRQGADRVWTLLRLANLREGFSRKEDGFPEQWFGAGGFRDYLTDAPVTREALERMVGDYYDEQGWDPETGVPTRHRLEELGL